jgi:N-acetyl-gamma-glutamyl-phosphate reductase
MVVEPLDVEEAARRADACFLCVPHTAAAELAPRLLERGVRVVDFSADYRLKDIAVYEKWYKVKHLDPANVARAVYGLPEIFAGEIAGADLVANPGCYPTSVILGAYPLVKEGLVEGSLIADSKSGTSGAGKKLDAAFLFCEVNEGVRPYGVGSHRHAPEMDQVLSDATGGKVKVTFVPHLMPMDRGIESTLYLTPAKKITVVDVAAAFEKYYADEPFVRLRGQSFGRTKDVAFTNFCDLAWTLTEDYVVVAATIDNLVKGAAGQAVECMNIMFGHERTKGLL